MNRMEHMIKVQKRRRGGVACMVKRIYIWAEKAGWL